MATCALQGSVLHLVALVLLTPGEGVDPPIAAAEVDGYINRTYIRVPGLQRTACAWELLMLIFIWAHSLAPLRGHIHHCPPEFPRCRSQYREAEGLKFPSPFGQGATRRRCCCRCAQAEPSTRSIPSRIPGCPTRARGRPTWPLADSYCSVPWVCAARGASQVRDSGLWAARSVVEGPECLRLTGTSVRQLQWLVKGLRHMLVCRTALTRPGVCATPM